MISEELKQNIIPNLKMVLHEQEWSNIEIMFEEVYVVYEDGQNLVCLHPGPSTNIVDGGNNIGPALMFTELTGAYYDIGQWEYIKKVGRKL